MTWFQLFDSIKNIGNYYNLKTIDHFGLWNMISLQLSFIATKVFYYIMSIKSVHCIHNVLQNFGGQCSPSLYTLLLLPQVPLHFYLDLSSIL